MTNLTPEDLKTIKDLEEKARKEFAGDKDQAIMKHILENKIQTGRQFQKVEKDWEPTDKFRIGMVLAPAWSVLFPPYSIAKLTSLLRQEGYSVKVYEPNIEAHWHFKTIRDENYWEVAKYFLWLVEENYKKYIFPDLKFILDNVIEDILKSNVKVVGLSIYASNIYSVKYIASALREAQPDLCIIAGGPHTITEQHSFKEGGMFHNLFNYIFVGETEVNLIDTMANLPDVLPLNQIQGSTNSRLDLNLFPYPDYTDYCIQNYEESGISMETSRGCIAQCSFCSETYFWKFRSIEPKRIVDEIEYQVKKHKIVRFWFVDSLANGNLKNFREFIDELYERKLGIRWHVMARCDGRMDFLFLRKVVATGCTALAFGVETGSQKVLHDMRKKVEVWEIENNLRDVRKAGMYTHVSWMVGFPTEEAIDNFHSMQVLYNVRKWIGSISLGFTMAVAKGTHSESNYRDYGIVGEGPLYTYRTTFLNNWYTDGYKNTIVHRFIRLKLYYIFLEIVKEYKGSTIFNAQQDPKIKNLYSFTLNDKTNKRADYIEQDFNVNFDYFKGSLADSIANEYVAFLYLLYKCFGKCEFTWICDPQKDFDIFGDYVARDYTCNLKMSVGKNDTFDIHLEHELKHKARTPEEENRYREELSLADMSFKQIIDKTGNISEWQTTEPTIRETIHEQYRN